MANIFDENDGYDSNEDDDYNPTAAEEAEADAQRAQLEAGLAEEPVDEAASAEQKEKTKQEVDDLWAKLFDGETSSTDEQTAKQAAETDTAPSTSGEVEQQNVSKKEDLVDKPPVVGQKRKIIQTFKFGDDIVEQECEVDEETAKKMEAKKKKPNEPKNLRVKGIDALLTKIAKPPTLSVTDKSVLDWKKHVSEKKLEEDLDKYDRSKDSYIDKMRFINQ